MKEQETPAPASRCVRPLAPARDEKPRGLDESVPTMAREVATALEKPDVYPPIEDRCEPLANPDPRREITVGTS